MKMKTIAPLVLSYCVEWARERDIGTKYHPKKYNYHIDSKMMTRIVRHSGDFKEQLDQNEISLFGKLIKTLINMKIVESPIRKETFIVKQNMNFNRMAIDIEIERGFKVFKGRPIKERRHKDEYDIAQNY
jgi:hypothetical protein